MEDKTNSITSLIQDVINNFKGVMLCSRPNQNTTTQNQKPFCARVYNHQQLGLVPIKKQNSPIKQQKKILPSILKKHKIWLEQFKNKQQLVKQQIQQKIKQQVSKIKKIKQLGEADRQRARKMKNQYNKTATQVINILDEQNQWGVKNGELTKQNLKKLDIANDKQKDKEKYKEKEKDKQKQNQQLQKNPKTPKNIPTLSDQDKKQQQQIDDLLNFFDQTQIGQFSQDEQVKTILINLRTKIKQLKQKDNWRQHQAQRINQKYQQKKQIKPNNLDNDNISKASANSQARSIASEKAQKNILQLKKKKQQNQQWDKYTVTSKHSFANIDEKIAKNLADEVLRNYPHLRGIHSNTSIRKLLQAQATKAIKDPIIRPVITTIIKDPKPLDTSNLPYLHRNPSI